jgi:hypothetical protein
MVINDGDNRASLLASVSAPTRAARPRSIDHRRRSQPRFPGWHMAVFGPTETRSRHVYRERLVEQLAELTASAIVMLAEEMAALRDDRSVTTIPTAP